LSNFRSISRLPTALYFNSARHIPS
jgi:hypothetical protein